MVIPLPIHSVSDLPIPHGFPDRLNDPKDIEELLWEDKDGLVAYKLKSGLWWTKKSSRQPSRRPVSCN